MDTAALRIAPATFLHTGNQACVFTHGWPTAGCYGHVHSFNQRGTDAELQGMNMDHGNVATRLPHQVNKSVADHARNCCVRTAACYNARGACWSLGSAFHFVCANGRPERRRIITKGA
eukprot:362156-Chlamydomonas_euryale.AAC.18